MQKYLFKGQLANKSKLYIKYNKLKMDDPFDDEIFG